MPKIKLVSSDLNGTLVHQHTMSDMIRIYIGEQQYKQANEIFRRQMLGTATIKEAFQTAGPLTRGLTLREAIEYTRKYMKYVEGFHEFVNILNKHDIPLVINSTGYSVTIYAIKEQIGTNKIHGHIGNFLKFGINGDPSETLNEAELMRRIKEYFANPESMSDPIYDQIRATGVIELGIINEQAKARLIQEYAKRNCKYIPSNAIAHMGDTMGDSCGIIGIAEGGGVGIAFNYNPALKKFLNEIMGGKEISGKIYFVDPKSKTSNLGRVLPIIIGE